MKAKILPVLLICLVLAMCCATAVAQTTTPPSDAQKAFDNLKKFAGSW